MEQKGRHASNLSASNLDNQENEDMWRGEELNSTWYTIEKASEQKGARRDTENSL